MHLLWLIFLGLFATATTAYERVELRSPSGTAWSIVQFPADSDTLVLWIPSKRGLRDAHVLRALDINAEGLDVWAVDVHETYMLSEGRRAYDTVEPEENEPKQMHDSF